MESQFTSGKAQMDLPFDGEEKQESINFLAPPYTPEKRMELSARVIKKIRETQPLNNEEDQFNQWSEKSKMTKRWSDK